MGIPSSQQESSGASRVGLCDARAAFEKKPLHHVQMTVASRQQEGSGAIRISLYDGCAALEQKPFYYFQMAVVWYLSLRSILLSRTYASSLVGANLDTARSYGKKQRAPSGSTRRPRCELYYTGMQI